MMYFSARSAQVRNCSVAIANGSITLIILLIAPLGLLAVLINTLLVMLASYITATIADRIVLFLQAEEMQQAELIDESRRRGLRRRARSDRNGLNRFWRR